MASKKNNSITLRKWGNKELFVYTTQDGKRITGSKSKFKSEKAFKQYIRIKGYEFKVMDGYIRTIEYKDEIAYETEKPIKRSYITDYRIMARYKGLSATSSFGKYPNTKEKDNDLKEQAKFRLALQIVGHETYGANTPPDTDDAERLAEEKFNEINEDNIKYSYIFHKAKHGV